jgi:hypothetical protein
MIHEAFLGQEYGAIRPRTPGRREGSGRPNRAQTRPPTASTAITPFAFRACPALNACRTSRRRGPSARRGADTAPDHVRLPEDRVQRQCDRKEEGVIAHLNASHRRRQSSSPPGSQGPHPGFRIGKDADPDAGSSQPCLQFLRVGDGVGPEQGRAADQAPRPAPPSSRRAAPRHAPAARASSRPRRDLPARAPDLKARGRTPATVPSASPSCGTSQAWRSSRRGAGPRGPRICRSS